MAEIRRLERLTASDLFVLLWDDVGWSGDIGALAILDGTTLLDDDGRVRIEAVRRRLEPRLHLVPRCRQRLYRPPRGLGWALWVDSPSFDLADHFRVHPLAAPADQAQLLQACEELARRRLDPARPLWEAWFLPGLPERRVGLFLKLHHAMADGIAGVAAFGALLDLTADAPTPAERCAGRGPPGRRGASSSPSSAPHRPASTAPSAPTASWRPSAAAWSSPSRSPTNTTPRSTTRSWPPWRAACASCWHAVGNRSSSRRCARWCPSPFTGSSLVRPAATRTGRWPCRCRSASPTMFGGCS